MLERQRPAKGTVVAVVGEARERLRRRCAAYERVGMDGAVVPPAAKQRDGRSDPEGVEGIGADRRALASPLATTAVQAVVAVVPAVGAEAEGCLLVFRVRGWRPWRRGTLLRNGTGAAAAPSRPPRPTGRFWRSATATRKRKCGYGAMDGNVTNSLLAPNGKVTVAA
eukprot:gene7297-5250_t